MDFSSTEIGLSELGEAEKVIVTDEYTRIIGGGGKRKDLEARVKRLNEASETSKSIYEYEKYQARLAMLIGGTAIIRVGGVTKQDIDEKLYGFNSGLNSAVMAIAHGAVVGGGLALLKTKAKIAEITPANQEEAAGIECVLGCLETPISCLMQNCNLDPVATINTIPLSPDSNIGFDAQYAAVRDLKGQGVLDSSSVLRTALDVAFSYAKMFIESSSWADIKSEGGMTSVLRKAVRKRATSANAAGARGSAFVRTHAAPIATGTTRTNATTMQGFVAPGPNSPMDFYPFTLRQRLGAA